MEAKLLHQVLQNTKLRLKAEYQWDDEFIDGAVDEYYKFLVLTTTFPNITIVPGKVVDKVWHDHILHTKEYTNFCKKYLSGYLHHTPKDISSNDEIKFEDTEAKYVELFGRKPPRKYWYDDVNPPHIEKRCITCPAKSNENITKTTFSCCRCGS